MSIAMSIFMLLFFGAVVIAALLFFIKILCEGVVGLLASAISQSKQLEQKSSKLAKRYSKKLTKIEMQIENILERQDF